MILERGEIMKKQGLTEEIPRLTVHLPPELENELYREFLTIARLAVEEATKGVMKNDRYLNQKQLAEYFKCGIVVINDWRLRGLKSFMKGKERIFDMEDVIAFLDTIKK